MTNINTACVKNNASYQLNNALPNKETISSNFCERLAQWGNKSLNKLRFLIYSSNQHFT